MRRGRRKVAKPLSLERKVRGWVHVQSLFLWLDRRFGFGVALGGDLKIVVCGVAALLQLEL